MNTNTKANLGLAILLAAASGTAQAAPAGKVAEHATANLDAGQKDQLMEILGELKADFQTWENAGPSDQPSKCYTR